MKTKVIVSILCILVIAATGYSEILKGEEVCRLGDPILIGSLAIPWSKANSTYGYIYSVEGLSYANVGPGPSDWKTALSYRSYYGFERCADINQDYVISLSSPSMLLFSSAQDPSMPDHRGILLFRYQGLWGAIEFVNINESGLHYKYWLNTGGECQFTSELPGNSDGKTIPNYDAVSPYPSGDDEKNIEYEDVEITGGENIVFNSPLSITGSLKIKDGNLILNGAKGSEEYHFKEVEISGKGALIIQGAPTLFVSGNWDNRGQFVSDAATVIFTGDGPQQISGTTEFYSLEIDTVSQVESSTIYAHILSVHSGVFAPGRESFFHHLFIGENGILYPVWGSYIFIQGDLNNMGSFFHNEGTITLDGTERQYIDIGDDPFYNLSITGQDVVFAEEPVVESRLVKQTEMKIMEQ